MYWGRVQLGSIRNKNNWNNVSKHLFGSHSHSGIPGFPFRLFCIQEQNSQNTFRNIFLIWNIPNERALGYNLLLLKIIGAEHSSLCINYTQVKGCMESSFYWLLEKFWGSQDWKTYKRLLQITLVLIIVWKKTINNNNKLVIILLVLLRQY